jgi:hypothetical protein
VVVEVGEDGDWEDMEMVFLFLRVTRSAKFRFLKQRSEDGRSLDLDIYFLFVSDSKKWYALYIIMPSQYLPTFPS